MRQGKKRPPVSYQLSGGSSSLAKGGQTTYPECDMPNKDSQHRRREILRTSGPGKPQTGRNGGKNDQLTFEIREGGRAYKRSEESKRRQSRIQELLQEGANPAKELSQLMQDEYLAALELLTEDGPHDVKDAKASAAFMSGAQPLAAKGYWDALTSTLGPFMVIPAADDATPTIERREGAW